MPISYQQYGSCFRSRSELKVREDSAWQCKRASLEEVGSSHAHSTTARAWLLAELALCYSATNCCKALSAELLAVTSPWLVIPNMIDLELWRARIGLYVHKCRRSARVRVNIVLARETRLCTDQKNEPSMKKPPDVTKPGTEDCKKPQETDSGKHGACTSIEGIEEAEPQKTGETPNKRQSCLHSTAAHDQWINLMRMFPLFIILLLLVCGDVELNPGPTLGELMITVCVCT